MCVETLDKMECILPMVISSEFRIEQYRDDDHREDAPQFINQPCLQLNLVLLHLLVLLQLLFFLFRQFLRFYLPLPVLDDRVNEIMSDGITLRELRFKSFIKHFRTSQRFILDG